MGDADEQQTWISQSRNGDHAAFAALIQTHQPMIHSLTYRMTGSQADCQDLAQETFIRAYQQLDSFNGTSKFSSWLYRTFHPDRRPDPARLGQGPAGTCQAGGDCSGLSGQPIVLRGGSL